MYCSQQHRSLALAMLCSCAVAITACCSQHNRDMHHLDMRVRLLPWCSPHTALYLLPPAIPTRHLLPDWRPVPCFYCLCIHCYILVINLQSLCISAARCLLCNLPGWRPVPCAGAAAAARFEPHATASGCAAHLQPARARLATRAGGRGPGRARSDV